jgi:hypothetical protein
MSLHNPSLWDRLIAQRILHLWDTHVGDPTQKLPLTDKDKLAFARAVLQASSSDSADQIRKLREALEWCINRIDAEICTHEETYRGGAIWTICRNCDMKWADDRGGFKPYREPKELSAARSAIKEAES